MFEGYSEFQLPITTANQNDFVDVIFKSDENIIVMKKLVQNINTEEIQRQVELTQSFVAAEIQNKIDTLFENDDLKWNIYILFLVDFQISHFLMNQIESNRFCCKKYIVHVSTLDNDSIIANAIIDQIPLFAHFEDEITHAAASSDTIIKEKIFQKSNQSPLARKFLEKQNIEQIVDLADINQFLDSLEQGGAVV
jgi:hypothetical protein